jgi:hypothetical protein
VEARDEVLLVGAFDLWKRALGAAAVPFADEAAEAAGADVGPAMVEFVADSPSGLMAASAAITLHGLDDSRKTSDARWAKEEETPPMPYYVAGGVLIALLATGAGSSGAAASGAQHQMQFVDYAWVTLLPTVSGPQRAALLQSLPAPPGMTSAQGAWHEYVGGLAYVFDFPATAHNPQGPHGPQYPVWPNVPAGASIFQWIPNKGALVKVNGYWVMSAGYRFPEWQHLEHLQGVLANAPHHTWLHAIAPPPGESVHSGKWHQPHPGYFVWITPTNANAAEQATAAYLDPSLVPATPAPAALPAPAPATAAGWYPNNDLDGSAHVAGVSFYGEHGRTHSHGAHPGNWGWLSEQDFYGYGYAGESA